MFNIKISGEHPRPVSAIHYQIQMWHVVPVLQPPLWSWLMLVKRHITLRLIIWTGSITTGTLQLSDIGVYYFMIVVSLFGGQKSSYQVHLSQSKGIFKPNLRKIFQGVPGIWSSWERDAQTDVDTCGQITETKRLETQLSLARRHKNDPEDMMTVSADLNCLFILNGSTHETAFWELDISKLQILFSHNNDHSSLYT